MVLLCVCAGESPEVKVEGEEVRVVTGDGCPSEVHVLVVVQEQQSGVPRPLASYSVEELVELTLEYSRQRMGRQATQPAIYIAANVSRGNKCGHAHTYLFRLSIL